ncbi:MAG: hypothetical protein WC797_00560 [Candidatus Paceibacterota bacterium]|jgi:hypothetical protein
MINLQTISNAYQSLVGDKDVGSFIKTRRYWISVLFYFFILVVMLVLFTYYLFFKVLDPWNLALSTMNAYSASSTPEVVNLNMMKKVVADSDLKAKKIDEILKGKGVDLDPSL